jgi:hypothetical protein
MRPNSTFIQVFTSGQQKKLRPITVAPYLYSSNNLTKSQSGFTNEPVYGVDDQGSLSDAKSDNAPCKKTDKRAS